MTDTFGAHPVLGSAIDLNDGSTFTLASPDGLEISAPPRSLLVAGNSRTQGEIATRAITRHNRTVTARLIVGPAASSAALIASIRTLLLWLAAPPQLPITLHYQPFNASTPLYLDVAGASHNLPADEGQWLRGQFEPLTISFITRPGLRDARVTLQNLVANAGLEQPSSAGFTAFTDTFANANFYATQAGSNPTAGSVNNNYPDVVMAAAPLRYYRMSEASGVRRQAQPPMMSLDSASTRPTSVARPLARPAASLAIARIRPSPSTGAASLAASRLGLAAPPCRPATGIGASNAGSRSPATRPRTRACSASLATGA